MNAYVFDIFITHSIVIEDFEEDGIYTTTCDLVEVGPLNVPDYNLFRRIKVGSADKKWLVNFSPCSSSNRFSDKHYPVTMGTNTMTSDVT